MQNRTPNRPRDDKAKAPDRQGNTIPAQGERQERVPRAPHERDESADSQEAVANRRPAAWARRRARTSNAAWSTPTKAR